MDDNGISIPGTDIKLPPWAVYVGLGGIAGVLLLSKSKQTPTAAEDETGNTTGKPDYGALILSEAQQSYDDILYQLQALLTQQTDFTSPPGSISDGTDGGTEPGANTTPGTSGLPGSDENPRTGPALVGPPLPVIPSIPGVPGTDEGTDGGTEPAPTGPVAGTDSFAAGDLVTSTYNGRPPWKGTGLTGPEWEKASPKERKAALAAKKARKRARESGQGNSTYIPPVKFVTTPPGFTVPAGPNPR